jgi:hypothetical protein
MNNPYENDESPLECAGCALEATMTAVVEGETTPLCSGCLTESTFTCVDCRERFWSCYAVAVYDKFDRCKSCADQKESAFKRSWQQRADEFRDDDGVRR